MTTKHRRLSVFLSYAFTPSGQEYDRAQILSAVERAADIASQTLSRIGPGIELVVEADVTSYGSTLNAGLLSRLDEADIAVVDITDPNPNVFYELGYLAAKQKQCIIISSKSAGAGVVPSDISGTLVLSYDSISNAIGRLADRLRACALERLRANARDPFYCRAAWGSLEKSDRPIVIVGPRTSSKTDFMNLDSVNYMFLDNLGDKDSIIELSLVMARLFPDKHVLRYVSDEIPRDAYENNLLVVGGPGIEGSQGNRLVNTLNQRLGIECRYSDDGEKLVMPDGTAFQTSFEAGRCVLDYGFFAKARNPFNPSSRVFMFHGIYTMGTFGASLLISDHPAAQDNILTVVEDIGAETDFWTVPRVNVIHGVPLVPELKIDSINILH